MRDDKTSRGWPLPYKANTLADDVERIRTLEAKLQKLNFLEEYGLYVDDDGDLCQDLSGGGGQSTTTDPDNPAVIIDGETVPLATQEDVQELLNELNLGQ